MLRLNTLRQLAIVLCLPAVAGAQALSQRFDSLFQKHYREPHYKAAAFVLVRDTSVIAARGYGGADPVRTVWRAASVSKLFAATAAMQLAEAGRVNMLADINAYLKGVHIDNRPGHPVTLASLLTHTSGLENRALGGIARDSASLVPMREYFGRRPPRADANPGDEFAYSNNGMGLAGYVVESASGEPFDRYVEERILVPLGMTSSSFRQPVPSELLARMTGGDRARRAPLFNPYPAGALMTTAMDMSRFVIAHLNGGALGAARILSDSATREMHATHWSANPGAPGVAYGFFESWLHGHRVLFHTGDSGHHGIVFLVPDARIGFYAVYDTQDDGSHEMMEELANAVVDSLGPGALALPTRVVAAESLDRYAGVYGATGQDPHTIEKAAGLLVQVRVEDAGNGQLRLAPPGAAPITARPVGPLLFRGSDSAWIAFQQAADGSIGGFTVTGGISDPFGARRLPWYARAPLHFVLLGLGVLGVLWRAIIGIADLVRRRKAPGVGWRLSGVMIVLLLLAPVLAVVGLFTDRRPYTALPLGVRAGLVLVTLASVMAVTLPVFAALAWKDQVLPFGRRVGFSVLAVTSALSAVSLFYWKIV